MRDRAPAGLEIAAGEYGYDAGYFRRMLEAGAVDVLQADATAPRGNYRLFAGGRSQSGIWPRPVGPLVPSVHLHPCCAVLRLRHLEYFHDHVTIERMLFDGVAMPLNGTLRPDLSRPGLGLELKTADAEDFCVWKSED